MAIVKLEMPYQFEPRWYQAKLFNAIASGKKKRAIGIWHRRAGKDKTLINLMACMMARRVGSYYYFLPTYSQGRKIIWEGMDRDGFPFLEHIPTHLVAAKNNTEMRLILHNGSIFRVVGSDNIDTIVGTNPIGCVFSEYSLQDPRGWDFVRPILVENGGWAAFNYTPRGRNHGWDLWNSVKNSDDWHSEILTVTDTDVVSPEDINAERMAGMSEDLIRQEFYCDFEAALPGAYFSEQLRQAREEGRICSVPHQAGIAVDTYWDLGMADATSIWFAQNAGREIRLINYYESSGEGLTHYVSKLNEFRERYRYVYGTHYAPHDIEVRDFSVGKTRRQAAYELGINFDVVDRVSQKADSIEAARNIINSCWFDESNCRFGLDALASYTKVYDESNRVFKTKPLHNWASHAADAFQTLAMGHNFYRIDSATLEKIRYKKRKSWMAA